MAKEISGFVKLQCKGGQANPAPPIDPETGNYFDDTKRYIEASKILSESDRQQIYEGNARRVFPRLDALLTARQTS